MRFQIGFTVKNFCDLQAARMTFHMSEVGMLTAMLTSRLNCQMLTRLLTCLPPLKGQELALVRAFRSKFSSTILSSTC